jgi:hypothetical protein
MTPIEAAEDFRSKVRMYRSAHFRASDHLRVAHYVLGFLLIAISALVSGSVLQATEGDPSGSLTLTVGTLSIIVVVLTAVQTTFKPNERGEQHKVAANAFGNIDRKIEIFIGRNHPDTSKAWDELDALAQEIQNVEAGAPGFLRHTYEAARKEVAAEGPTPMWHAPRHA